MSERFNPTGTKLLARRRMTKPGKRRYRGVAKRLADAEREEEQRNQVLRQKMEQQSSAQWSIQDACCLDGSWLDRIALDVFDDQVESHRLSQFLDQSNHAMFLATTAQGEVVGQVRGIVTFQPDAGPQLYLDNLGVAPNFKRHGIATALVNALVDWATLEFSAEGIWLGTEIDNEEAQGFYSALGFRSGQFTMFEK